MVHDCHDQSKNDGNLRSKDIIGRVDCRFWRYAFASCTVASSFVIFCGAFLRMGLFVITASIFETACIVRSCKDIHINISKSYTDKKTDASWDIFMICMKNKFWAVGCGLGWTVKKKGLGRFAATVLFF